jgi:hypothetical protein
MRWLALGLLALAACGAPNGDPGADALVVVRGAIFYREEPPPPSGGPAIETASFVRGLVLPGSAAGLSGRTPAGTGGLVLHARGDVGYWAFVPGLVDSVYADQLDFAASVVLAARATDEAMIDLYAVGVDGLVGAPTTLSLTPEPRPAPSGALVVSLDWDVQADLDLRVVDPNGAEIWHKKINSYVAPPPPASPGPDAYLDGGILDFDSNAECVIDGLRQENVIWHRTPPVGTYTVRVDTFSLCGLPAARWHLRVLRDDALVTEARGTSLPSDTRFDHGPGAGLLVLDFEVAP